MRALAALNWGVHLPSISNNDSNGKDKIMYRIAFVILVVMAAAIGFADNVFSQAASCNYYASPSGTGNGLSQSSPFRISNFWSVAGPGKTLCLLDGTYAASDSMINPPQNLKGLSGTPITVRAINDGKVLITGQASRMPVYLYRNDWFVIEGINACCSNGTVVQVSGSSNNIVRRVAAWDAADNNNFIFGIHGGKYNLLEDVAGWGIARKIFESSWGGDFTTVRRMWGRWEGSHVIGPKMVYTIAYNNYNLLLENVIGTWSGERMKQTYVLMDYYGQPWTGAGAGTYTNYGVDQPYGVFGLDRLDGDKNSRSKLLGSIGYVKAGDRFEPDNVVFMSDIDSLEITNTVVYIDSGSHTSKRRFGLFPLSQATAGNLRARNLTGVGGANSYISADWQPTNILEGSGLGIYKLGQNVFNSTQGGNLCYRYQDGVLTQQALWPWPMNQRIKDAMITSGRTAVDVTATIEAMFGSIPAGCKGASTGGSGSAGLPAVSKPSAPVNLQVK